MKLIEELYYGNLHPNGAIQTNASYDTAMQTLGTNEELLCELLEGKEKKLFLDFVNAWSTVNGTDTVAHFTLGFQLGAKLIAETLGADFSHCVRD